MTVSEHLMSIGSWSLDLDERTPDDVVRKLAYFSHVAVVPGKVDPRAHGDGMLSMARYVGVLRSRAVAEGYTISGAGMSLWLGDDEGKGPYLGKVEWTTDTSFANVVNDLLPPSVHPGTIHSVAGTYRGSHEWQTPRTILDFVCGLFSAEWRVNPNGTLDAGTVAQMYQTDPSTLLARKEGGRDMRLRGLSGAIASERDISKWASQLLLLGEAGGQPLLTGISTATNPYKDLHGNPVDFTMIVNEPTTPTTSAQTRADVLHQERLTDQPSVHLDADDFDISGSFKLGDAIFVWDPQNDLVDTANEIPFRGRTYYPMVLRVVELTWPVEEGHTVALRDQDGVWIDLTPYVKWETGSTALQVGAPTTMLLGGRTPGSGIYYPDMPDGFDPNTWPDLPILRDFPTRAYTDTEGRNRAFIVATWDRPLNTDGSTITDGSHYEVRYRRVGDTSWVPHGSVGWE